MTSLTNEVERVDIAEFFVTRQTPPQTSTHSTDTNSDSDEEERYVPPPIRFDLNGSKKCSGKHPMVRSHTIDAPTIPQRHSTNPFLSQTPTRSPLLTTQSLDLGRNNETGMEPLVRASPEDIRQLLRRESNMRLSESSDDDDDDDDYIDCRIVNDLSDMPRRPPPPIPVRECRDVPQQTSKAHFSLDVEIPAYQVKNSLIQPPFHTENGTVPKQAELIRETEYEIMNPQRESVFLSKAEQAIVSTPLQEDVPLEERDLPPLPPFPPLPPLPGTDLGILSRSRSAHSFSHSNQTPNFPRGRRGTIASTRRSETLKEIDEQHGANQGARSLDRLERKSRSFDDLQDDDLSGLHMAESLTDVLARTYSSRPGKFYNLFSYGRWKIKILIKLLHLLV